MSCLADMHESILERFLHFHKYNSQCAHFLVSLVNGDIYASVSLNPEFKSVDFHFLQQRRVI